MLGEQVLELDEQLLGNHRRTPKLAKVRNNSPLRFNVTLALIHVAERHFQFGLAVHFGKQPYTQSVGPARKIKARRYWTTLPPMLNGHSLTPGGCR